MTPRRVEPGASVLRLDRLARIELRDDGPAVVATIVGEVDISNVGELARALASLPNLAAGLVVDLSSVGYLDSAGISLLHELANRLEDRSQPLVIVCPEGAPCRRVLDLTAMDLRAPLFEDLTAAIGQFSAGD